MQEQKASIHGGREHFEARNHDTLCAPGQTQWGYPEEQRYESFETLYGPDAYMGDSFPYTLAGSVRTEMLPPIQPKVQSGLKPEIVQEQTQQALVTQEKSIKGAEEKAAQESGITPFRGDEANNG